MSRIDLKKSRMAAKSRQWSFYIPKINPFSKFKSIPDDFKLIPDGNWRLHPYSIRYGYAVLSTGTDQRFFSEKNGFRKNFRKYFRDSTLLTISVFPFLLFRHRSVLKNRNGSNHSVPSVLTMERDGAERTIERKNRPFQIIIKIFPYKLPVSMQHHKIDINMNFKKLCD